MKYLYTGLGRALHMYATLVEAAETNYTRAVARADYTSALNIRDTIDKYVSHIDALLSTARDSQAARETVGAISGTELEDIVADIFNVDPQASTPLEGCTDCQKMRVVF